MSLCIKNVRLTYPDGDQRLVALDDVNLDVGAAEFVAVTGPSGSGKSSLLAVAGALLAPDSGSVRIRGTEIVGLSRASLDRLRREQVGLVFQQSNLLASLTALDQLLLVSHVNGSSHSLRLAGELLDRVGLAAKAGKRPHELSGGERQRVGVARALMGRPGLLLVDEPTSSLDHHRGREVVKLLREICVERKVATVMVTHDVQHLDLTDRAVTMNDGRLTAALSSLV